MFCSVPAFCQSQFVPFTFSMHIIHSHTSHQLLTFLFNWNISVVYLHSLKKKSPKKTSTKKIPTEPYFAVLCIFFNVYYIMPCRYVFYRCSFKAEYLRNKDSLIETGVAYISTQLEYCVQLCISHALGKM